MSEQTGEIVYRNGKRIDVDQAMAEVEKGQQLAGHFPNERALTQGRRVLLGKLSADEAVAEVLSSYRDDQSGSDQHVPHRFG